MNCSKPINQLKTALSERNDLIGRLRLMGKAPDGKLSMFPSSLSRVLNRKFPADLAWLQNSISDRIEFILAGDCVRSPDQNRG